MAEQQQQQGDSRLALLCHLRHLHVGFLLLSVSREQKWVTAAVVGCPAWPAGSATVGECANILEVKPWKLLGASGEAAFCFV